VLSLGYVEKYFTARQGTDDNIIRCMHFNILDDKGYKDTPRIYNTFCLATVTMVMLTRFNITFIRKWPLLFCCSIWNKNVQAMRPECLDRSALVAV